MNSFILFRSNNSIEKDNYKVLFILIFFFIFKIFTTGIYPVINGDGNLYIIFKPLLFYIIYCLIEVVIFKIFKKNKKIDNYFLISSLIISYILPSNTSLCLFVISSIIGNIISNIIYNKISSVVISSLLIFYYLSISNNLYIENYTNIFNIIFIILCLFGFIYLYFNKLNKIRVLLFSLISTVIINIVSNNNIFDNSLFYLLFIVSDNRYTPVKKGGQLILGIIYGILIYFFKYILRLDYYLLLSILLCEVLSLIINYLSVLLSNNRIIRKKLTI